VSLCVCLSAAACPHYCTDPDVTWGTGRECPVVVHYWADLQSVHGLRCYGNIRRTRNVCEYMLVLALCLVQQVTATCPPVRAHWRYLANTIEFVHPTAHSSPQPKRQIDRLSRFCTANGRKCLKFTMAAPISTRIAPFKCGIWTPCNTMPWARASPQPKRHLERFSCVCTDDRGMSPYFTVVCLFPLQNCTKMCLAAGLRPDPLGSYSVPHIPYSCY